MQEKTFDKVNDFVKENEMLAENCAVIAGVIYGTMLALVTFVNPVERDVTIRIPSERINKPQ